MNVDTVNRKVLLNVMQICMKDCGSQILVIWTSIKKLVTAVKYMLNKTVMFGDSGTLASFSSNSIVYFAL